MCTFFQRREIEHIGAELPPDVELTSSTGIMSVASLSAASRDRIGDALASSFHDRVWVLVTLAVLALVVSTFLSVAEVRTASRKMLTDEQCDAMAAPYRTRSFARFSMVSGRSETVGLPEA